MAIPSRNGPGWMGCLSSRFILHIWKPKLSMTVLVRQGRSQCTIRVMVLNYFSWNIPASENYFCLFVLFYFSPFSLNYWLCGWVDSPRSVPAVKCAPLTRLSRCLSLVSLEFEFGCRRAAAHEDRPAYQSDRRVTTQQLIAGLTWDATNRTCFQGNSLETAPNMAYSVSIGYSFMLFSWSGSCALWREWREWLFGESLNSFGSHLWPVHVEWNHQPALGSWDLREHVFWCFPVVSVERRGHHHACIVLSRKL